ncbi:hypothetical protein D6853_13615 [Butyrivibrio sp. X503]|uniref:hypothetical protein n=1 Tax=Butyrivibrio sp. X503 TaxID=2364878 RepID=UPI000EA9AC05|nr:hypothetical protein [Butyrivibrio sp. X503]RKM54263.1 hypothetical protein D6853_13615 [Butyrivibrio sp. X503]
MKKTYKISNFIISLVLVLVAVLFMGFIGDYWFEANDDVLIKDLLSGAYTGAPEGHNIQMLYPISFFFSLLYRVVRSLDWYGIFLCGGQYLCLFLIAHTTLKTCKKRGHKIAASLFMLLFAIGVVGSHFLFIHYTFTCGFMSGTAAFLILMHEKDKDKNFEIALILLFIAFLLRSEMLLLTLPMVCVAIFIRWLMKLNKTEFFGCLKLFGAIVTALVIGFVIHQVAFSKSDWKQYNDFFEARTQLYDYQNIPEYEENKEFYDNLGLDKSEYELLVNYNFGLDDKIDTAVLNKVASCYKEQRSGEQPFAPHLKQAISEYIYELHNFSEQKDYLEPGSYFPWNVIVIVLYIGVLISYILPRKDSSNKEIVRSVGALALLFACRTSLWIYMIMGRRIPIRIAHPLFFIEIMILFAMLLKRAEKSSYWPYKIILVAVLLSALSVPNQKAVISAEQRSRELMRMHYDALDDYFDANEDNFYFIDTYTSVSCGKDKAEGEALFSEKLFDRVDNSFANHDLMGGWGINSPLTKKKLAKEGFTDMQSALLTDKAYFVQNKSESTDWLVDYYRYKGLEVTIEQKDVVADAFAIYAVREK